MRRATNVLPPIADALAAARRRHADARARAVCPNDGLEFTPLYTDGRCPLDGWTPGGYHYARPAVSGYDRHWGALGAIAVVSLVMLFVVVFVLTHT